MPYFGKWPFWFDLFIESCKCNPTIEWLFFSDCGRLDSFPSNVRYIEMSWDQCKSLILKQLDVKISSENPYKLCDIKPAYGQVFSEYIKDCDFFGFGDIDVVYGNIRSFITESILEKYDLITTNDKRVNGHFCLLRNSLDMRTAFMSIKWWKDKFEEEHYTGFDEMNRFFSVKQVYGRESFSTPFSPYVPWTHNVFEFPENWYWRQGSLTNDFDGEREFLYLHFLRMKNQWCEEDYHLSRDFTKCIRINKLGFFED